MSPLEIKCAVFKCPFSALLKNYVFKKHMLGDSVFKNNSWATTIFKQSIVNNTKYCIN